MLSFNFTALFIAISLACCSLHTNAQPLPDIVDQHQTSVRLQRQKIEDTPGVAHSERFLLSVARRDDLINDETDKAVAHRLRTIELTFDIRDGIVYFLGRPLRHSLTHMRRTVRQISGFKVPEGASEAETAEIIRDRKEQFNDGLVGISIAMQIQRYYRGGIEVRRITLQVNI